MTRDSRPRFEGAITTSDEIPDQTVLPPAERPRRPILIELASAILIVGGLTSLAGVFTVTGLLQVVVLAINLLTIVVGILIRAGRGWVLALNVVVIAIFLELTAISTSFGILFLILDSFVLFALLRHRPWFEWQPDDGHAPA